MGGVDIKKLKQEILQADNPVGCLRLQVVNTNPAEYLGFGEWELWGKGKVPVGVDENDTDFNIVEKTGGEKEHVLTINEMPIHNHDYSNTTSSNGAHQHTGKMLESGVSSSSSSAVNDLVRPDSYSGNNCNVGNRTGNHTHTISGTTKNAGNDQSHNNLQPYITCYIYKRVK